MRNDSGWDIRADGPDYGTVFTCPHVSLTIYGGSASTVSAPCGCDMALAVPVDLADR